MLLTVHTGQNRVSHLLIGPCGRTVDHTGRELLEFAVRGWQKRCNDDMALSQVVEESSEISGGISFRVLGSVDHHMRSNDGLLCGGLAPPLLVSFQLL